MRVLLDEMYPAGSAARLNEAGIEATTVAAIGLAGSPDTDVFAAAVDRGCAVLTENVGDFTRIAADYSTTGRHHHGLLIALSPRFSRQLAGSAALVAAIAEAVQHPLDDRVGLPQVARYRRVSQVGPTNPAIERSGMCSQAGRCRAS